MILRVMTAALTLLMLGTAPAGADNGANGAAGANGDAGAARAGGGQVDGLTVEHQATRWASTRPGRGSAGP